MAKAYSSLGLRVIPDPFASEVSDRVIAALRTGTPFSAIRLGDGEMNIIAYDAYPEMRRLCDRNFRAIMQIQEDSIALDALWKRLMREMLISAIAQADVVGVLGIWFPGETIDVEKFVQGLGRKPRGLCGYWQGLDYLPRLARAGLLGNKVVTAAHLYLGVLRCLDRIVPEALRIVLVTDHVGVVEKLRRKFPDHRFDHIFVGTVKGSGAPPPARPDFLERFAEQLPHDMADCLCLVGAGFWAEIYCTWIKQRGGVAVDIGSGFNLLNGAAQRPVHRQLGLDQHNPFALE